MTTVEEAITTYYQKKATYDKDYERKKETIRKDGELSEAEKREKIRKIARKCIVCESSEGTIFSQTGRVLSAICGNRASPCPLNINIERPSVKQFADVEEQLNSAINKLKDDVILSKYNILFNFSQFDSAFVDKADEIRKKIKDYDDLKKKYNELYAKATKSDERRENAAKEEYDFLVKVGELKEILKESDIVSANEHYINVMLPMLNKIRREKYDTIDVVRETAEGNVLMNEDKSDKGEYSRLIREPISLNNSLITVMSGLVNSNESKKEKRTKPVTAKAKKTASTTTGTLKKKKLVVAEEPTVATEEISP
jgi:hypothetical protein